MTSRVPPVSIAATATPSPPASSSTRLSDSGPCDGKDEQRRVRDVRQRRGAIEPAGEADVEAGGAGRGLERGAIGTVADDDQRPRELRREGRRHQVLHALVEGELADVDRVRAGDVGERRGAGGRAARIERRDVHRVGDHLDAAAGQRRRAGDEIARHHRADGDDGVGLGQASGLPSQVGAHVGDGRQRRRPGRRRRAARTQRVIIPAEHAGHSVALDRSWIRSDQ